MPQFYFVDYSNPGQGLPDHVVLPEHVKEIGVRLDDGSRLELRFNKSDGTIRLSSHDSIVLKPSASNMVTVSTEM